MQVFYWVFNMSIAAAFTGLVVLLLRTIRKIPRRFVCFLWAIPFLRMLIPIGLNSRYSFMSLLSRFAIKTVIVFAPVSNVEFSMANFSGAADSYFPITFKVNYLEQLFFAASIVWIVVFLAIIMTLSALYMTTMRELKDAIPLRENIYLSEKVQSPAVYGICKPRIVLPLSYQEKDLEHVLAHERMHIRRGDNVWRIAAFIITAIHWYQPLAWLFLKLFLADMELACDECVISKLDLEQRKQYARSLVACREKPAVFASAFGGAKIRTRVENILSFQQMTRFSLIAFSVLCLMIGYLLLTNAA